MIDCTIIEDVASFSAQPVPAGDSDYLCLTPNALDTTDLFIRPDDAIPCLDLTVAGRDGPGDLKVIFDGMLEDEGFGLKSLFRNDDSLLVACVRNPGETPEGPGPILADLPIIPTFRASGFVNTNCQNFDGNHTRFSATDLGQLGGSVSDQLTSGQQRHYYKVSLGDGDTVTASGEPTDPESGVVMIDLAVVESNTEVVVAGPVSGESISFTNQTGETTDVFARFTIDSGLDCGLVDVEVVTDGACRDDSFEPNDTLQTATPINSFVYRKLVIQHPEGGAASPDAFTFLACPGGMTTIRAEQTQVGTVDYSLFTADDLSTPIGEVTLDGQQIHDFEFENAEDVSVDLVILAEPTFEGQCGEYKTIAFYRDCGDDDLEDNDTPETATLIEGQTASFTDVISNSNDPDFYQTDICPGGTLTVDVLFSHDLGNLNLTLFQDDGSTEIDESRSLSDNEQIVFENVSTSPMTLIFLVEESTNLQHNTYEIDVAKDGCPAP
jgi:hypothetical protein